MGVSAEIAVYVASLGDNQTWQKLPSGDEADYNFIKKLKDQVISLAGDVRSSKGGGTTGHIGMVMTPAEFVLIANTVPFVLWVHPVPVNCNLPTACTTIQQHRERKHENVEELQVFEMERMFEKSYGNTSSLASRRMNT